MVEQRGRRIYCNASQGHIGPDIGSFEGSISPARFNTSSLGGPGDHIAVQSGAIGRVVTNLSDRPHHAAVDPERRTRGGARRFSAEINNEVCDLLGRRHALQQ
jgi:hypothetical protein